MTHAWSGRRATAAAAVAAAMLTCAPAGTVAAPVDAAAESTTFMWSGESELASGDQRMSTPGNWSGGVAPVPGQQVDLVFPALTCVLNDTCGQVVNDVVGLVATSVTVTTPGRPPGPATSIFGYTFTGDLLRLTGPLRTGLDTTYGTTAAPVGWNIPVELGGSGGWFLRGALALKAPVIGRSLKVKTQSQGGLIVQDTIETKVFKERGRGASEVLGGSVNAEGGGRVVYDGRSLRLADARLGPLELRGADLSLAGGTRPTRVLGGVSLDDRTEVFVLDATGDHPLLKATGRVDLGGAKLNGAVDCTGAKRGEPFEVISGRTLVGRLTDRQRRPMPEGRVVRFLTATDCSEEPVAVRIGYTPRALTFTIISIP